MSEDDIKKQLEQKNKEIYLNKVAIDIQNNYDILLLTINNLLDKFEEEFVVKIIEIKESSIDRENIKENITNYLNNYKENLKELLLFKKENILESIKQDLDINNLMISNSELKEKILLEVDDLYSSLVVNIYNKFVLKRIKDYINNIYLDRLNSKVLSVIKDRDITLKNALRESYDKYLYLNSKTIG